ncbi:8665_t:CDS:1, partial [Racocetra persica]
PSKGEKLKSIPEIEPYARFLEIETAPNSLANLSSSFEQILQLAKNTKAIDVYLYVNISMNNVVVYLEQIEHDPKNQEFINAIKKFEPKFIYQPPEQQQHTKKRQPGIMGPT